VVGCKISQKIDNAVAFAVVGEDIVSHKVNSAARLGTLRRFWCGGFGTSRLKHSDLPAVFSEKGTGIHCLLGKDQTGKCRDDY
jgi:hypothetical protein